MVVVAVLFEISKESFLKQRGKRGEAQKATRIFARIDCRLGQQIPAGWSLVAGQAARSAALRSATTSRESVAASHQSQSLEGLGRALSKLRLHSHPPLPAQQVHPDALPDLQAHPAATAREG